MSVETLTWVTGTCDTKGQHVLWCANRHQVKPFVPSFSDKEMVPLVEGNQLVEFLGNAGFC